MSKRPFDLNTLPIDLFELVRLARTRRYICWRSSATLCSGCSGLSVNAGKLILLKSPFDKIEVCVWLGVCVLARLNCPFDLN